MDEHVPSYDNSDMVSSKGHLTVSVEFIPCQGISVEFIHIPICFSDFERFNISSVTTIHIDFILVHNSGVAITGLRFLSMNGGFNTKPLFLLDIEYIEVLHHF